jgi:hypothetical protein
VYAWSHIALGNTSNSFICNIWTSRACMPCLKGLKKTLKFQKTWILLCCCAYFIHRNEIKVNKHVEQSKEWEIKIISAMHFNFFFNVYKIFLQFFFSAIFWVIFFNINIIFFISLYILSTTFTCLTFKQHTFNNQLTWVKKSCFVYNCIPSSINFNVRKRLHCDVQIFA